MSDTSSLLTRGVAQVLPSASGLEKLMQKRKIRLYLGIDPTGSLLTLGHAVVLKKLQQFAEAGHEVILLIGNGTVRIGDPTGRDSTRPVLTDEIIAENFQNWKEQASKILDFSRIEIRKNGDWLDKLTYSEIVKLMAQVTVPQLMERDMFQERLKKGGTVFGHEILYPLLQGYDSVMMEVDLEIGGTDQTFNMLMGRHLLEVYKNREKYVLSTPIINGTDGRKMSKSYGNFIALTDEPNDMFGKLMSVADSEMETYFEIFTDIDMAEVQKKIAENPRDAKVELATNIVSWLHSPGAAKAALQDFETKFVRKETPENIPEFTLSEGVGLLDLITKICGFATSNAEARRLMEQGAVALDDTIITDTKTTIEPEKKSRILRVGKRKWGKIL